MCEYTDKKCSACRLTANVATRPDAMAFVTANCSGLISITGQFLRLRGLPNRAPNKVKINLENIYRGLMMQRSNVQVFQILLWLQLSQD